MQRISKNCLLISSALILIWIVSTCQYGLDITDEGFYLNWISNPSYYKNGLSLFGFIYHPLYKACGENIVLLRQINILLTFSLSLTLCFNFLKRYADFYITNFENLMLSSGLAITSLNIFQLWLITPNYNTLNFQALLLIAIGIILIDDFKRISALLFGFGGYLAFMAKPSSAVCYASLLLFLIFKKKRFHRILILSFFISFFLFILFLYSTNQNLTSYFASCVTHLKLSSILWGKTSSSLILKLDQIGLSKKEIILVIILLIAFITILTNSKYLKYLWGFSAFTLIIVSSFPAKIIPFEGFTYFRGILFLSFPVTLALLTVKQWKNITPLFLKNDYIEFLIFLFFPFAFSFGTGSNHWRAATWAIFFIILSSLILFFRMRNFSNKKDLLIIILLVLECVTFLNIRVGLEFPYRQPQDLFYDSEPVKIRNSFLMLTKHQANYYKKLDELISAIPIPHTTPIIDLTGKSPGLIFYFNGLSTPQPWLLGAYPGSTEYTIESFNLRSCKELVSAWILIPESKTVRKISETVLESIKMNIADDYTQVAKWTNSLLEENEETSEFLLYRPAKNQLKAISDCENKRNSINEQHKNLFGKLL